jgi:hypothetical protein
MPNAHRGDYFGVADDQKTLAVAISWLLLPP